VKSAAPRRDPMLKVVMYVVGGLILAGVAFNILSAMGLVNGVGGNSPSAKPSFVATGNIATHVDNTVPGKKGDIADLSGTVTNNTSRGCTKTEIVGTMLDQNGAVVTIGVAAKIATESGQTASWKSSVPYVAQTNTITHATWAALCGDAP
jgi:hypothetical protein